MNVYMAFAPPWAQVLPKPPPSAKITQTEIRPYQRALEARGRLGATGIKLHQAAPGGRGAAYLRKEAANDRCKQRWCAYSRRSADYGAAGAGIGRGVLRFFAGTPGGAYGRAGSSGGQHKPRVRFESHAALHTPGAIHHGDLLKYVRFCPPQLHNSIACRGEDGPRHICSSSTMAVHRLPKPGGAGSSPVCCSSPGRGPSFRGGRGLPPCSHFGNTAKWEVDYVYSCIR